MATVDLCYVVVVARPPLYFPEFWREGLFDGAREAEELIRAHIETNAPDMRFITIEQLRVAHIADVNIVIGEEQWDG